MDFKTLKTFQWIVSTGSFNRAAEELNYAQSTVTMQIQRLESELGVQLIERGKPVALTEAGRLFYEHSRSIVKDWEHLQTRLSDMRSGEAGHIRLGVTEPAASYRLPGLLQRFLTLYPHIRVSVDIASTPALSSRLLNGDLDMALCSAPELGAELYFEPLFTELFALLLPERHPLSEQAAVDPQLIRDHRLLITADDCPYRRKLELVLQETGRTPLDTMEIGSMAAMKYYVQSGLGIALVPQILLEPVPEGTTVRMLRGKPIDMTCGIACKAADYPLKLASAKLYHFLRQELSNL